MVIYSWGSRYGPSLLLGSEMMKEFSYFNFKVEGNEMPMLRHALMCWAIKLEDVLKKSWCKIDVSKHQYVQAYGKLAVRCVLFLLQKQKHGRDETMWESFEEICEAFGVELANTASSASAASTEEDSHGTLLRNLISASGARPPKTGWQICKQGLWQHLCSPGSHRYTLHLCAQPYIWRLCQREMWVQGC